jgi:hypothetical protein
MAQDITSRIKIIHHWLISRASSVYEEEAVKLHAFLS